MTAMRRTRIALAGLLLGLVLAPAAATAASAHDALVDSDPATDAVVETLTQVELTFSAAVMGGDGANVIQVVGPDGAYYETACPALADAVVTSPVEPGAAGTYEVRWRVVSSDGHPVSGSYTFEYAPADDAAAASGSDMPLCGDASDSDAGSEATGTPSEEAAAGTDPGLWVGLGIGGVVVIALIVAVVLIARSGRDRSPR